MADAAYTNMHDELKALLQTRQMLGSLDARPEAWWQKQVAGIQKKWELKPNGERKRPDVKLEGSDGEGGGPERKQRKKAQQFYWGDSEEYSTLRLPWLKVFKQNLKTVDEKFRDAAPGLLDLIYKPKKIGWRNDPEAPGGSSRRRYINDEVQFEGGIPMRAAIIKCEVIEGDDTDAWWCVLEGYPKEEGEEPPAIRPKLGPPPQESEADKPVEKKEEQGKKAKAPAPAPATTPAEVEEVKPKGKKGKQEKKSEEGKEAKVVGEPSSVASRPPRKVSSRYNKGLLVGGDVEE
mgnify:CR=1 FL=1|jgi:hypothetical protein